MALPYTSVQKKNGTAVPSAGSSNKALIIGPSSAGIKETTLYPLANTAQVTSDIGYGNAALAAQMFIAAAPTGFGSVDVLVASASTAGAITQVSAASPIITVTGTPLASYDVRADITVAGITGSCKFRYSLDGGNTYTESLQTAITTSGSYTIPNTGLSLNFAGGTHAVGNQVQYDVQGPTMTTADLAACITSLSNSNTNYTCILVADDAINPVAAAPLFAAMDTHLTTLNNTQQKPTMAVINVGGETNKFNRSVALTPGTYKTANVLANITGSASSEGNFACAVAEKVNTYIPVPQPGYARPRLPFAFAVAKEIHAVGSDLSLNIAQFPVAGVETPSYDEFKNGSVYHDERIIAPRTFMGESGVSVNQGLLKYNPATGASFNIIPKGRVINRASELVRASVRPFLNSRIEVKPDGTGRISDVDKQFIEATVNKQLEANLLNVSRGDGRTGHCSALQFVINGENNILTTGILQGTLRIVPLGYVSTIEVNIYFTDVITA